MKILIIEDDHRIANALAEALTDHHYLVELAADGEAGFDLATMGAYHLIILDVMLPKRDGIAVCQQLRQRHHSTLILMLTARDSSSDRVLGLDAGADDYVVKPFDMPELLARIRALLRRGSVSVPPVLEWERLQLDPSHCVARYAHQPLDLTPKEYALLDLFLRSGSRVLSRNVILEQLWPFGDVPGEQTVKVHLQSVRRKLKQAGAPPDLIENVYGMGYRLNPNL